ncbi:hypothetical protein [Paenibacillus lemnae]|uniref:Uncharacterized protein n=1 Tax=Paenibacillus lemnae TaxID=1330551 RepID=A0A848M5D5_PAELE|nr:hypothetical protein [Paenibacillus lemnae]NMO95440.1 hypothetical protein [Paenibacillus lemnae]
MQQWLILMTSGLRGMMVTSDPQLNSLLPVLGFKKIGHFNSGRTQDEELTGWELDFRQTSFHEWIQIIIRQTDRPYESLAGATRRPYVNVIDLNEMKQILLHLFDTVKLEQLAVVKRMDRSGNELQRMIHEILIESCPKEPLSALEQQILKESYLQRGKNKNQLSQDFHMSRTTFYRHSQSALRHLGYVLTQFCGHE